MNACVGDLVFLDCGFDFGWLVVANGVFLDSIRWAVLGAWFVLIGFVLGGCLVAILWFVIAGGWVCLR